MVQDFPGPPMMQNDTFVSAAEPATQNVWLFASSAAPSADPAMENSFCVLRDAIASQTRVHRQYVPIADAITLSSVI